MYYIYDNSHSKFEEELVEKLLPYLNNIKEAEIFLENINYNQREKMINEKGWNRLISGKAKLEENEIVTKENNLTLGDKYFQLAIIFHETSDHIDKIDTGPIFPNLEQEAEEIRKAQKNNEEVDTELLAKHIVKRDLKTAQYIEDIVKKPRKSFVIMGASHNLNRLLSKMGFDINTLNEREEGRNEDSRRLALNILNNEGYI